MIKIGEKYNMLTVLAEAGRDSSGHKQFLCLCDCGEEKVLRSYNVESGIIKSCGCYHDEAATTHGKTKTIEYRTWCAMKRRCYNSNVIGYENYGGRGIELCDRWKNSFESFLKDMGKCPKGYTIERKNNALNYSPDNCKWATRQEQASNTRRNHNLTFNNLTKTLTQLATEYGIGSSTLRKRLQLGWSIEDALITGVRQ